MNLRIMKKLSKQAAVLLPSLTDGVKYFISDGDGEGHLSTCGFEQKHCDRYLRRDGTLSISQPTDAWRGTHMVGWSSGGYEPEWEEQTCYEFLKNRVYAESMEYTGDHPIYDQPEYRQTRRLKNPRDIFRAAKELMGGAV